MTNIFTQPQGLVALALLPATAIYYWRRRKVALAKLSNLPAIKHIPVRFLTIVALILPFATVFSMINPAHGSALSASGIPPCLTNYLGTWDWPGNGTDHPGVGTLDNSFSPASSSYVITQQVGDGAPRNVFTLYVGNNITLNKDATTGNVKMTTQTPQSWNMYKLVDEPKSMSQYDSNYYSNSIRQYVSPQGTYTGTPNFSTSSDCMLVAHNVQYGPGWDYEKYAATQAYTKSAGQTCSALEVGCWISKAMGGVTDTLANLGTGIIQGIAYLFSPDQAELSAKMNSFQTFMTAKLGFLTYPFTYFGSLFTGFTSNSNWCTETSCTKDFGQLFGKPVSMNLIQLKTTMPALWTYILLALRGMLVFGLIYGLRKKYLEVVSK